MRVEKVKMLVPLASAPFRSTTGGNGTGVGRLTGRPAIRLSAHPAKSLIEQVWLTQDDINSPSLTLRNYYYRLLAQDTKVKERQAAAKPKKEEKKKDKVNKTNSNT